MPTLLQHQGVTAAVGATVTSLVITPTATIPAGSLAVVTLNRSASGTTTVTPAVTDAQGNTWTLDALSQRASAHQVAVFSCRVATPITGPITAFWSEATSRAVAVLGVWSGAAALLASSGVPAAAASNVSMGANGSSLDPAASTTAPAAGLVVSHSSRAGTATVTTADMIVDQAMSPDASSQRGIAQSYRVAASSAIQTASWTLSATQGWAAATTVYEVTDATTPVVDPPVTNVKIWDGTTELPATMKIWTGTEEVPIGSLSVT